MAPESSKSSASREATRTTSTATATWNEQLLTSLLKEQPLKSPNPTSKPRPIEKRGIARVKKTGTARTKKPRGWQGWGFTEDEPAAKVNAERPEEKALEKGKGRPKRELRAPKKKVDHTIDELGEAENSEDDWEPPK